MRHRPDFDMNTNVISGNNTQWHKSLNGGQGLAWFFINAQMSAITVMKIIQ